MANRYDSLGKTKHSNNMKRINKQLTPGYSNSRAMPGRESRTASASSGLKVFRINDMDLLKRFLITGSTGSMYLNQAQQMNMHYDFLRSIANAGMEVGIEAVCLIESISESGRAARNDSAIMALAVMCDSNSVATRRAAFTAVHKVARTGTHLFQFISMVRSVRGLGRGLRKAINSWYLDKDVRDLAYQISKYRNREGWTHRDVLRLTRPKAAQMNDQQKAVINYAVHPSDTSAIGDAAAISPMISAYEELKRIPYNDNNRARCIELIQTHNIPHEVVPNDWKGDREIWKALLVNRMPATALMRNLSRMTRLKLFGGGEEAVMLRGLVKDAFTEERIQRARLHPLNIYMAMKAYTSGRSKGGQTWTADKRIVQILEEAFYNSFKYSAPSGKRIYVGLDVSGSMCCPVHGEQRASPGYTWMRRGSNSQMDPKAGIAPGDSVSAYEAEVILTKALVASEGNCKVKVFDTDFADLTSVFQADHTLPNTMKEVVRKGRNFGATNLSLPIQDALADERSLRGNPYDAFVIFTDNEVNVHGVHPQKLIEEYRRKSGKNTRFIVVGMKANRISIADPADPYMLDIGGFDSSLPKLISEFIND